MVPLRLLRPEWIAAQGRERVGVELDCPRHPDGHRVRVWFENPPDGGPPATDDELHQVWLSEGDGLEHLTVLPIGSHAYRPVQLGHWLGWLIEGELSEARVSGVAW